MTESRTQITVAIIGLVGALTTALIANSDKFITRNNSPAGSTLTVADDRNDLKNPTSNSPDTENLTKSTHKTGPDRVAPGASLLDVTGLWHDADGSDFRFVQSGQSYRFTEFRGGQIAGSGAGTLAGHDFEHRFETLDGTAGQCRGTVDAAARSSSGHCRADTGEEWDFTVTR